MMRRPATGADGSGKRIARWAAGLERQRRREEDGAALIIMTISLVLICVIAALVIDVGNVDQQRQQARSVADSAALSASLNWQNTSLTSTTNVWLEGFNSAFKSLNLTPPSSGWSSCPSPIVSGGGNGVVCYAATVSGKTVYVASPWNNTNNWVHVVVCWSAPAFFGKVIGVTNYGLCASATAQYSAPGGTSGGSSQSGCSTNDLSITGPTPVTFMNPDPTNAPTQQLSTTQLNSGTVLKATYSDPNGVPFDPNSVVFLAPNASGVIGMVTPTISGTGGTGTTISYTLPATMASVTATLFVVSKTGSTCGQVVWTSCDFAEEDFFWSTGKLGTNGTSTVFPLPGAIVSSSAALGAKYNDETQMNPARSTMFLNQGNVPINFSPTLPCDTYVAGTCTTDIGVPSLSVSVVDGTSQTTKNNVTETHICNDQYANSAGGTVNVQLCDYLGDPIAGKTVQLQRTSGSDTVSPASAVTGADGVAAFTFTGTSATNFNVVDTTDNITLTQTVAVPANNNKNATVSPSYQLKSSITWPASKVGGGDTSYQVTQSYPLSNTTSLAVGWNSAFIYSMDTDQNKAGGDCAWAVWSFTSTNGTGRAGALPTLVQ